MSADLLPIFADEAAEVLARFEAYRAAPTPAALAELFDLAHNLRGSAALVGLAPIERRADALVSMTRAAREDTRRADHFAEDVAPLCAEIRELVEHARRGETLETPSATPAVAMPEDLQRALSEHFLHEAHEHLTGMRETLLDGEHHGNTPAARSRLYRHLLNLQTSAALAGEEPFRRLSGLLITLLEGVEAGHYPLGLECLHHMQDGIELAFSWLDARQLGTPPATAAALDDFARALEKDYPIQMSVAPATAPEADDDDTQALLARELADIFRQEGSEHLAELSHLIVEAEKPNPPPDLVNSLFRTVHTLKGAAATVGYHTLAEAAHELESRIDVWRQTQTPFDETFLSLLYMGERTLRYLLEHHDVPEAESAELVESLKSALHEVAEGTREVPLLTPVAEEAPEAVPTLRVTMNRVDRLMNLVSELYTYRARFDDRTALFAGLSKKLAWERKARGKLVNEFIRRHQYERPESGGLTERTDGFSELEFDRYSDLAVFARSLEESEFKLNTVLKRLEHELARASEEGAAFSSLIGAMRDDMVALRMVPLQSLFERVTFQAMNLSHSLGKRVIVRQNGGQTEVDKALVDALGEALLHIVRNALDHGLETPEERRRAGKPEQGTLTLSAQPGPRHVVVQIRDDGRGIDDARVAASAVQAGYLSAEEAAARAYEDRINLIFFPRVSSRTAADEVSGRGVGLDAVRHMVANLYGSVHVDSVPGAGTCFTLTVPLTLAMQPILTVAVDEYRLNLPMAYVEEILEPGFIVESGPSPTVLYKDEPIPLRRLSGFLRLDHDGTPSQSPAVVLKSAERRMALAVDAVGEREEAIVRPLPALLDSFEHYLGTTITPHGDVRLVLNIPLLFDLDDRLPALAAPSFAQGDLVKVLIADDSLSVRQTLKLMLERHGLKANTAKDGLIAWQKLHGIHPDLMIVDLEMPGLNGYELMQRVRQTPEFLDLPLLVLTSRTGQKHMDMAYESGADGFLTKPVLERELLATIRDVLPPSRRDLLDERDHRRES